MILSREKRTGFPIAAGTLAETSGPNPGIWRRCVYSENPMELCYFDTQPL